MPALSLPAGNIGFPDLGKPGQQPPAPILAYRSFAQPTTGPGHSLNIPNVLPYTIPEPANRPRRSIFLRRIYLPLAFSMDQLGGTIATSANVQLILSDGLKVFWTWSGQFPLTAGGPVGGKALSNMQLVDDLINPVDIEPWDLPSLYGMVSADQGMLNPTLYLGAQIVNPNVSPFVPVAVAGTAYYDLS